MSYYTTPAFKSANAAKMKRYRKMADGLAQAKAWKAASKAAGTFTPAKQARLNSRVSALKTAYTAGAAQKKYKTLQKQMKYQNAFSKLKGGV